MSESGKGMDEAIIILNMQYSALQAELRKVLLRADNLKDRMQKIKEATGLLRDSTVQTTEKAAAADAADNAPYEALGHTAAIKQFLRDNPDSKHTVADVTGGILAGGYRHGGKYVRQDTDKTLERISKEPNAFAEKTSRRKRSGVKVKAYRIKNDSPAVGNLPGIDKD